MLGFTGLNLAKQHERPATDGPLRLLESAIKALSPAWAVRRARDRQILAYYEAAKPSTTRRIKRESGSADVATLRAGATLREQARHLEQNHDLARGVLDQLETNIVGAQGITIEPQPRNKDGSINPELAAVLRKLLKNWSRCPEVTAELRWPAVQRLGARTWCRDGEFLSQIVNGYTPTLDHKTIVPFSLELLEPDFLPFYLNSGGNPWIVEGVEKNAWGRPVAYHLHKTHPGDWQSYFGMSITAGLADFKRVPADKILHVKLCDRFRQTRGVSVFASVLSRLDDIKDYEESERIAAKIAASMAAFIKKGRAEDYDQRIDPATGRPAPRNIRFQPGMVFDDLEIGEEIGMMDTNRPNQALESHRNGQLRAAASGCRVSYSSWSKSYDGNYSARRQELVDAYAAYAVLQDAFASQFVSPVYENLVSIALLSGLLPLTRDVDLTLLDDALYIGPQMPWIDPAKEANAWETLERNRYASGPEIIRKRGQDPDNVLEQSAAWKAKLKEKDLDVVAEPQRRNPNAIPVTVEDA